MDCPACGAPIPEPPARCSECQRPVVGQPRRAPAASDGTSQKPGKPTESNIVFWFFIVAGLLATILAVAVF